MISQEISYYPQAHDDDEQRLFAERLAKQRDSSAIDLGRMAMLAVTGGALESSSERQDSQPETSKLAPQPSIEASRAMGRTSLSSILIHDGFVPLSERSVLGYKDEYTLAA